ncbi:formin-J-like isoform X2 [Macrosteles quadrilineatus]|uniref:formin-J-like isoform X2 n=1 Tax=Macrosteles quadrilineatus TaxID=74068 RepID=UPI0023E0FDC2|nr:formin-J-like isoform X2 [Macrosteles quadrilineatus]
MVLLLPLLHLLPVFLGSAEAGALRYDQTQTGDTNIHLQIKNVEVLALLDDVAPGEYDYDYNDFTEKPHKPHNVSGSSLAPPEPPVQASNMTSDTAFPTNSTVPDTAPPPAPSEEPLLGPTATPEAPQTSPKKSRRCGAGFYRDTLGRCRRIRRPHLQMLVNLGRKKPIETSTES